MIKIDNLSKIFFSDKEKLTAVNNVNLNIKKGEIFGIIGLSGAGKSTLIRCLNRLEEPTKGKIFIDGIDLTALDKESLRKERKEIGMIFQHFNLLSQKTVYENIAFPLQLEKMDAEKIHNRVNELLEYVDLKDKKNSYPSQLSGGQKQRVAIARAIANNPKILLSDEGTSALDPKTTKSILELLKKIRDELNITIVMITHQMEVVKEICDRVAIMEDGQVVEENTVENLFREPKTKIAQAFISSLQGNIEEEIINPNDFKGKLIRLSFLGDSAKKPIVSKVIRNFNIDVNILSGNINKLQSTSVGHLILELIGEDEEIDKALSFLENEDVHVEVI
ncbi:methionine ABC transporter ATP-binding protein [Tissierella sp. P1]|jgi:D-methionine transport system ATP-binding protein|uniref:methionine ABC transporter ATP-binding protein n=1 Tax=Tissierella sp. P1 TaxID=1280483 RepID=UPI000B9FBDFB|nr:methionine ABC transporter ATP-binding protein [Tissierella sp. P1]MDU5080399.1 methionine ABC transporter ATP-binding protein [Bacillota bacterium]OZV13791.1 methionine ABC transporter ATP-binding protein [Tissierella sp. P1]